MARINRRTVAVVALFILAIFAVSQRAVAQAWISFTNETAARFVNAPGDTYAFTTDPDEKDYAVGDVDNDGDDDVVLVRKQPYSTSGGRSNFLLLNENGVLVNRTAQLVPQFADLTNDRDVVLVDVNGDGWLDVVTATNFPPTPWPTTAPQSVRMPRVYVNLGADAQGNWLGFAYNYADQRIPDYVSNYPFFCSVSAGDVDGDGDADLFFVDYASDNTIVALNPPGGALRNRLLLNNGSGFFADVTNTNLLNPSGNTMYDIRGNGFGTRGRMADMNGDGWLDLLAQDGCSANPRTIRYARNNGPIAPGVFETTVTFSNVTVGHNAQNFDTGDINNDGRLDVFEVDDANDSVFVNNGNNPNGWPLYSSVLAIGQTGSTTSGFGGTTYCVDLDNDGRLDQVVCDEEVDLPQSGNRMALLHNTGVSPWVTETGDPLTLDGTLGVRDTYDAAILDLNRDGKLDLVVGTKNSNGTGSKILVQPDTTPPHILSTNPPNGTRDVFQDRDSSGALQGITQLAITIDSAVRDNNTHGNVTPASFPVSIISNLPGLSPPAVMSVARAGNTYTLTFDRPITPGAWNLIIASVEDWSGNILFPNRILLGFLPGDVNQNGTSTGQDVLTEVTAVNACAIEGTCTAPEVVNQYDVNRNGLVTGQDVLRLVQLENGVNTQNAWNGVSLPPPPP